MSTDKELTPEQQFNKILGEGAQRIKQLEQLRDNPPKQGPSPKLTPQGASQNSPGVNKQAHKDYYNDRIGNEKASVIKQADAIAKNFPKDVQKQMKGKVMQTLYQQGSKDINKVNHPSKMVDNSQEKLNQAKADHQAKSGSGKVAQAQKGEGAKGRPEASRFNQQISKEKQPSASKQPQQAKTATASKAADNTGNKAKASPSTRFTQSLNQSKPKAMSNTPGKSMGSMSGRFTQSLGNPPGGSSGGGAGGGKGKGNTPTSPGGGGGGRSGGGGKSKD